MEVRLIRFRDDGARRDFRVKGSRCVIGREVGCTIQIPSPAVSRRHCEVRVDGDRLLVRDMGSSNGTFVNEKRITAESEVAPGDRLAVGPIVFVVQIDGTPESPEPPLLESPALAPRKQPEPEQSDSGDFASSSKSTSGGRDLDDSAADIADLIARATSSLNENDDSSAFDFELDLDDDEK